MKLPWFFEMNITYAKLIFLSFCLLWWEDISNICFDKYNRKGYFTLGRLTCSYEKIDFTSEPCLIFYQVLPNCSHVNSASAVTLHFCFIFLSRISSECLLKYQFSFSWRFWHCPHTFWSKFLTFYLIFSESYLTCSRKILYSLVSGFATQ